MQGGAFITENTSLFRGEFGSSLFSILLNPFSSVPSLSLSQLVALSWLGIFANGLAFVFWFKALRYGDTAKMSNIVYTTPFLSLIYSYFLIGEDILFTSLIGLLFIVLGIVIQLIPIKIRRPR